MPKGTLRGSPPNPADDLTTLRTSFYLVAQKKLDSDLITDFTESLMNARRDLLGGVSAAGAGGAARYRCHAYVPAHPGAAAFYNGTQESFLDKWGNIIFLAPMITGALPSVLAAAWQFLRAGTPLTREQALDALYALGRRIRVSGSEAELDEIEQEIDRVLKAQRRSRVRRRRRPRCHRAQCRGAPAGKPDSRPPACCRLAEGRRAARANAGLIAGTCRAHAKRNKLEIAREIPF